MLSFGAPNCLEHVGLFRTREVHHNLPIVRPQSKSRVVLGLYGRGSFVDLTQTEDIVDGSTQTKPGEDLLFFGGCYLDELASNLDDNLDLAF